ncbi:MAG: GNAT family acetyltransferase [Henriciella sp.]|nr:GNAT family acetyltransferase [Henriciella sp.]
MSLAFKIRAYQARDKAGVVTLWEEVFPGEAERNKPEDVIARKLTVQPDLFFVALHDDRIVGTVIAGFDGVRGWIHKLAVHPDFRRQGLASMLMQRAEDGLKEIGCPKVNLQVRAANAGVIAFYESLGFDVEDRASLGKALD